MSLFKKILHCYPFRNKLHSYYYFTICFLITSLCIINSPFFWEGKFNTIISKVVNKPDNQISSTLSNKSQKNLPMKYILLWTNPKKFPFIYFGEGNSIFLNKSCKWTNCFVTGDRNYLRAIVAFEVIAFNGPQLPQLMSIGDLPMVRHTHQKYVYANIESAANYPFRDNALNNYFNWTWTYKLNSDAVWGYIVIKDAYNRVIGPRENMQWLDPALMDPIDEGFKLKLRSKKLPAAWISSYCHTLSRRENYVMSLQLSLNTYNIKIDVYGKCGDHVCTKEIMSRCLEVLKKNYYFYLAFENSFSEDYVTEKILYALNYDTIPIVYGGANYSRFLPEGSYLDAVKMTPKELAAEMNEIINDREKFYDFFRWKKYYSFHATHESPTTDTYCNFCAMLNNDTLMQERKSYKQFNAWWMHKVTKVI